MKMEMFSLGLTEREEGEEKCREKRGEREQRGTIERSISGLGSLQLHNVGGKLACLLWLRCLFVCLALVYLASPC